jgi:hypothetical protein
MKQIKSIALIILCLFALRSPADDFRVLDLEYNMPLEFPWMRVISSDLEWWDFYTDMIAAQIIELEDICDPDSLDLDECEPPPPPVDFEHQQIILGGLGVRLQGASKIVVSGVDSISDDQLNINVLDINPSLECVTTAVISYPMVAIAIDRSDKPINITVEEATLNCYQ